MLQCVHFWGWKSLESPLGYSDSGTDDDKMTIFQTNMCSILVRGPRALGWSGLEGRELPQSSSSWLMSPS